MWIGRANFEKQMHGGNSNAHHEGNCAEETYQTTPLGVRSPVQLQLPSSPEMQSEASKLLESVNSWGGMRDAFLHREEGAEKRGKVVKLEILAEQGRGILAGDILDIHRILPGDTD